MDGLISEERALLESIENDEWMSVSNLNEEIKRCQSYAESQLGDLKEIKIELPESDFQYLQALANQSEASLQIIIAGLLHQFVLHNRETS